MNEVEQFGNLFWGRTDAYGSDAGGCVRERVSLQTYVDHLSGKRPIGIYPLLDDGTCWWGCSDIDQGYDMLALAVNLWRALKALGLVAHVERSKSKGYHVWMFANRAVPAEHVRRAFLLAHQVIDLPPKEVNPKQVEGVELGNYVRLPYPNRGLLGRQVMLDMGRKDRCPLSLDQFLAVAVVNTADALAGVAAKYVPPPPPKSIVVDAYSGQLEPLVKRMGGLAFTLFTKGPLPNLSDGRIDRSSGVLKMAYCLRDDHFMPGEALALLSDYDQRYGKFSERPDGVLQLDKILRRVYG